MARRSASANSETHAAAREYGPTEPEAGTDASMVAGSVPGAGAKEIPSGRRYHARERPRLCVPFYSGLHRVFQNGARRAPNATLARTPPHSRECHAPSVLPAADPAGGLLSVPVHRVLSGGGGGGREVLRASPRRGPRLRGLPPVGGARARRGHGVVLGRNPHLPPPPHLRAAAGPGPAPGRHGEARRHVGYASVSRSYTSPSRSVSLSCM